MMTPFDQGKLKVLALAAFLLFSALVASPAFAQQPPEKFHPAQQGLPTVTFEELSGAPVSLSPWQGQSAMVVNMWATWCPPCVKEMPSLNKLAGLLKGTNIKVFAIAEQTETADVSAFFKRQSLDNLTPYMDRQMLASRAIGARGLPTTIIVSSSGQIIGRVEGDIDWADPATVAWLKTIP